MLHHSKNITKCKRLISESRTDESSEAWTFFANIVFIFKEVHVTLLFIHIIVLGHPSVMKEAWT